jgi:hypothetical protein
MTNAPARIGIAVSTRRIGSIAMTTQGNRSRATAMLRASLAAVRETTSSDRVRPRAAIVRTTMCDGLTLLPLLLLTTTQLRVNGLTGGKLGTLSRVLCCSASSRSSGASLISAKSRVT